MSLKIHMFFMGTLFPKTVLTFAINLMIIIKFRLESLFDLSLL